MWVSWSSTRPNARHCIGARVIPGTNTSWVEKGLRAALKRRTWGCRLMLADERNWTWPSHMHSHLRQPAYAGLHPKQCGKQGEGMPLVNYFDTPPGVLYPAQWSPNMRRTWTCWNESTWGHKDDQRAGAALLWRQSERVWDVQPSEKKTGKDLQKPFKTQRRSTSAIVQSQSQPITITHLLTYFPPLGWERKLGTVRVKNSWIEAQTV